VGSLPRGKAFRVDTRDASLRYAPKLTRTLQSSPKRTDCRYLLRSPNHWCDGFGRVRRVDGGLTRAALLASPHPKRRRGSTGAGEAFSEVDQEGAKGTTFAIARYV
jgi:hypothetical protein